MSVQAPVKISRDLEVVQIPEGYKVRLARGTEVRISQSLGGTITAMTEYGTMVRIAAPDADALGEAGAAAAGQSAPAVAGAPATVEEAKERVWTVLRTVYDPEIPVNVVELGLVYTNDVVALPDGGYKVGVKMTLTAPGCGMGPVLQQDAVIKIRQIPTIKDVNVEIVVDPPWNQSMMSEAARLELGL